MKLRNFYRPLLESLGVSFSSVVLNVWKVTTHSSKFRDPKVARNLHDQKHCFRDFHAILRKICRSSTITMTTIIIIKVNDFNLLSPVFAVFHSKYLFQLTPTQQGQLRIWGIIFGFLFQFCQIFLTNYLVFKFSVLNEK